MGASQWRAAWSSTETRWVYHPRPSDRPVSARPREASPGTARITKTLLTGSRTLGGGTASKAGCSLPAPIPRCDWWHAMPKSLQNLSLTGPTWPATQVACNKRATYEHATAVGVATPSGSIRTAAARRQRSSASSRQSRAKRPPRPQRVHDRQGVARGRSHALLAGYDAAAALVGCEGIIYKSLFPAAARRSFPMLPFGSTVRRLPRWWRGAHDNFPWIRIYLDIRRDGRGSLGGGCRVPVPRTVTLQRPRRGRIQARCPRWAIQAARCQPATLDLDRLGRGRRPRPAPNSMATRPRRAVEPASARAGVGWCHASRACVGLSPNCKGRGDVSAIRSVIAPSDGVRRLAIDDPMPGIVDLPVVLARVLSRRRPLRPTSPERGAPSFTNTDLKGLSAR